MRVAAYVVWLLASLYLLILVARMVIGLVMAFSRGWRPAGAAAAAAEVVYALTDPPLKGARRLVKPVQLGQMSFDLGFLLVAIGVSVVASVAARIAAG
ncbi:MAG: YggT family protein [Bifidobacteriaceae bacterium]|nr:YggT family protein [Bifidobacteriaceae bacterium]